MLISNIDYYIKVKSLINTSILSLFISSNFIHIYKIPTITYNPIFY